MACVNCKKPKLPNWKDGWYCVKGTLPTIEVLDQNFKTLDEKQQKVLFDQWKSKHEGAIRAIRVVNGCIRLTRFL